MRRLANIGSVGILAMALFVPTRADAQFTGVSVGLSFGLWDGVGVGFYGSSWDGPYHDGFFFSGGFGIGMAGSHGIYTDYGRGWTHWSHRAGYWRHPLYYAPGYGASSCWVDVWDPWYDPWACSRSYGVVAGWWSPAPRVVTSVYWRDPFWDPWGPYYSPTPVYVYGGFRGWSSRWYPRVGTRVAWAGRRTGRWGSVSPWGYKAPARDRVASTARPRGSSAAPARGSTVGRTVPRVQAPRVTRPLAGGTPSGDATRTRPSRGSVTSPSGRGARDGASVGNAPDRTGGTVRTSPTGRVQRPSRVDGSAGRSRPTSRATPARSATGRTTPSAGAARSGGAVRSSPSGRGAGNGATRSGGAVRTSPTGRVGGASGVRSSAGRSSPTGRVTSARSGAGRTSPSRGSVRSAPTGTRSGGAVRNSPSGGMGRTAPTRSSAGRSAPTRSSAGRTAPTRGTVRSAPARSGGSVRSAPGSRAGTVTRTAPARSGSRAPAARSGGSRSGSATRAPARSGGSTRGRSSGTVRRKPGG